MTIQSVLETVHPGQQVKVPENASDGNPFPYALIVSSYNGNVHYGIEQHAAVTVVDELSAILLRVLFELGFYLLRREHILVRAVRPVARIGKPIQRRHLPCHLVLSQEVMFRQKALQILQTNDMKLPHFPWIMFEDELRTCMEHGTVYNLASVKTWVAQKRSRYLRHRNATWQLYGYDIRRYGAAFNDALRIQSLFDVLETYAQA